MNRQLQIRGHSDSSMLMCVSELHVVKLERNTSTQYVTSGAAVTGPSHDKEMLPSSRVMLMFDTCGRSIEEWVESGKGGGKVI